MDSRMWKQPLLFILIIAGVAGLLEWRYRAYVTPPDILFYKLKEKSQDYTHLYIGNSHIGAFYTYNPDSTAKVRNLSIQGQDLFKEWAVLYKWLPLMPNVKCVMLGLDYEIIGQNQTLSGEEYLDRQYYKYTDTLYRHNFSNVMMARSNFFRANRDVKYLFSNGDNLGDPSKMDLNFIPVESRHELKDADCKKRAIEHSQIKFKHNLIAQNLVYVQNIITLCKERNVRLFIINTPKSDCFRGYVYKPNSEAGKRAIDSLLTANGVHYYDFEEHGHYTQEDFADYDHLTYAAARQLLDSLFTGAAVK